MLAPARAGDAAAAAAAARAWVAAQPPARADAWHPYPTSTRVVAWLAAETLAPGSLAGVADSLWQQLVHVARNVEDGVLGNHVVRNAVALVAGGAAFDEPKLRERGLRLLLRELPEQVLPDGGHYERSPVYHLVVLRDLLLARAVSGAAALDEPVERMRAFAAALARPDGGPALFNDGGLEQAPRLELPPPPAGLSVLADTGYAVHRSQRLWLAFDCGPPAPAFLPAHAHADALSLQLWVDGRPLLADAGTYTYEPGVERDWFRGTRSHSTVTVDGRDQFRLWGSFRSGPLPRVRLREAREGRLEGSAAYAGVRHERAIRWDEQVVVVEDRVDGRGERLVESRLVEAPGAALDADADADEVGEEEGWVSERFHEREPARILVARRRARLPVELAWTIRLPKPPLP